MTPSVEDFSQYVNLFIQRIPRYAIKDRNGGHWRTRQKPLADPAIKAHLEGKYYVGSLGCWYPQFCIIDIDDREKSEVEDIRAALGLDDANSMLSASQSANSFHILFRPQLNGRPPTINRLHTAMKGFAKENRIEIYPQRGRVIRMPFGPYQPLLDEELSHLTSWNEKLYWFQKLNEYDLGRIEGTQLFLNLNHSVEVKVQYERQMFATKWNEEAENLLTYGLQFPSTREHSQFVILYHFFRANVFQEIAEKETWKWITKKNNGFSKDFRRNPDEVKKHIQRQASHIYTNYDMAAVFPDSTHNLHNGFIYKPDIENIIRIAGGNMPRTKFLFHLLKYSYPRRYRNFISIHYDKLTTWAGVRTYLKYLNELENKGIVKRGTAYSPNAFSKNLKLNWQYHTSDEAIHYSGRSLNTLESTLALVYKPQELRELLLTTGTKRTTAIEVIRNVYECQKRQDI